MIDVCDQRDAVCDDVCDPRDVEHGVANAVCGVCNDVCDLRMWHRFWSLFEPWVQFEPAFWLAADGTVPQL